MRVMDLTGRESRVDLAVSAGPAYELLITLCAFGQPGEWPTMEIGPAWFEDIRRRLSADLRSGLERMGPRAGKIWVNLLGLAVQDPHAGEVQELIDRIGELPATEVRLTLMGIHVPAYQRSVSGETLRRAGEGDPEAAVRLMADKAYWGGEAEEMLLPLLRLGVDETKALALEVLQGWHREVFADREGEMTPVLERDAETKRAQLATMSPEALIETASGIQYIPDASISQVFLIPQLTMRPWVMLCEHDDTRLFCYPVADESIGGDATAPPGGMVRFHKALGDEKRLRMLKFLATETATLQDLADRFGLPKSTAHHHLAILRAAGLVRVTSDYDRTYSVRRDVLPEAARLIEAYLEGGRQ